jgi:hypothetical protein
LFEVRVFNLSESNYDMVLMSEFSPPFVQLLTKVKLNLTKLSYSVKPSSWRNVEESKILVRGVVAIIQISILTLSMGGGTLFVELLQVVQIILMLNVVLPSTFYDFLSIFGVRIF